MRVLRFRVKRDAYILGKLTELKVSLISHADGRQDQLARASQSLGQKIESSSPDSSMHARKLLGIQSDPSRNTGYAKRCKRR